MNFFELLQEIRFAAPTKIKKITPDELYQLVTKFCKEVFGEASVQIPPSINPLISKRIIVHFGNRTLRLGVSHELRRINVGTKDLFLPSMRVCFDWDEDPTDISQKDPTNDNEYPVNKTLQRDTMIAIHKMRDGIFRKLAEYAIAISYVPIGKRRESLYASVMTSSGFEEMSAYGHVWLPRFMEIT